MTSEAELYARINCLHDKTKELQVLKYDLVDYIVELKLLLKDLPEDLKPLAIETLSACPAWFLLQERKALARRAGIVSGALLNSLRQNKTGFSQLSYKEKAMIFAHEAVTLREKNRRKEIDFNGLFLYKAEMIKKIVELQILLGDVPEGSRSQAEKKYMESSPWSYEFFKDLLDGLNARADVVLTGFYSGLKKYQQKLKFNPRNRLTEFFD